MAGGQTGTGGSSAHFAGEESAAERGEVVQHSGLFQADKIPPHGVGLGPIGIIFRDWCGSWGQMHEVRVLRAQNLGGGVIFQILGSS